MLIIKTAFSPSENKNNYFNSQNSFHKLGKTKTTLQKRRVIRLNVKYEYIINFLSKIPSFPYYDIHFVHHHLPQNAPTFSY